MNTCVEHEIYSVLFIWLILSNCYGICSRQIIFFKDSQSKAPRQLSLALYKTSQTPIIHLDKLQKRHRKQSLIDGNQLLGDCPLNKLYFWNKRFSLALLRFGHIFSGRL